VNVVEEVLQQLESRKSGYVSLRTPHNAIISIVSMKEEES